MFQGTLDDVQETHQGAHKMNFGDAVASVAPNGFFRVSMRFPRHARGMETVEIQLLFDDFQIDHRLHYVAPQSFWSPLGGPGASSDRASDGKAFQGTLRGDPVSPRGSSYASRGAPGLIPGRLSRAIQGHICTAEIIVKTSKNGHDIRALGSLGAPWGLRRCDKAPQTPPGPPNDAQETIGGARKMNFGDATTSVAPSRFS